MKHLLVFATLALFSLSLNNCSSKTTASPESLKAPFAENKSQADSCYEKALKKQPDIGTGTVELKFLINEEGKAYKTIFMKKKSTLTSKLLNACLKKVVSTWQFPAGKALEVAYPFTFEKAGAAGTESESAAEPKKQSDMDVIDTSPQDESSGDEQTPTE